jgi:hypothetical protein
VCKIDIVTVEDSTEDKLLVHSFRPLIIALTPTEAQPAYEAALRGLVQAGNDLLIINYYNLHQNKVNKLI